MFQNFILFLQKSQLFTIVIIVFFSLLGCESNYHYGNITPSKKIKSHIKDIDINQIAGQNLNRQERANFKQFLQKELEKRSTIKIAYRTPYSMKTTILDKSYNKSRKMGKFLGAKQYRVLQEANVYAYYSVFKKRKIILRGSVRYTPSMDTASATSFVDAIKKSKEIKLKRLAEKLSKKLLSSSLF